MALSFIFDAGGEGARAMSMRISRAALCALVVVAVVSPAYGLTSEGIIARLEAAGYSQIREMKSGKITTYKAVRAGKEVSLVIDSFGKFKELP